MHNRIYLCDILYISTHYKFHEGIAMRKFKIPVIPESTNKSIRFPNDVIASVEEAIRGTNCTFSAFVIEAVRVALDNLNDEQDDKKTGGVDRK